MVAKRGLPVKRWALGFRVAATLLTLLTTAPGTLTILFHLSVLSWFKPEPEAPSLPLLINEENRNQAGLEPGSFNYALSAPRLTKHAISRSLSLGSSPSCHLGNTATLLAGSVLHPRQNSPAQGLLFYHFLKLKMQNSRLVRILNTRMCVPEYPKSIEPSQ